MVFLTIVFSPSGKSTNFCSIPQIFDITRAAVRLYRNSKASSTPRQFQIRRHLPSCLNYIILWRTFQFTQIPFAIVLPLISLFRLDQIHSLYSFCFVFFFLMGSIIENFPMFGMLYSFLTFSFQFCEVGRENYVA